MKTTKNLIEKIAALLAAGTLAVLLGGCCTTRNYPVKMGQSSVNGTPVLTCMSARSTGVRILYLGGDPSRRTATKELYAEAADAGYPIAGNNYAFQNMYIEESDYFLWPILGWKTLHVSADLYRYEYTPGDGQRLQQEYDE